MIHSCSHSWRAQSCRSLISQVLTDQGICSSYNARSVDEVYKPSAYVDLFKRIFGPHPPSDTRYGTISSTGRESAVRLVLDVHQADIQGTERGHFVVGVNGHHEEFNVLDGLEVYPGQRSALYVGLNLKSPDPEGPVRGGGARLPLPGRDAGGLRHVQRVLPQGMPVRVQAEGGQGPGGLHTLEHVPL